MLPALKQLMFWGAPGPKKWGECGPGLEAKQDRQDQCGHLENTFKGVLMSPSPGLLSTSGLIAALPAPWESQRQPGRGPLIGGRGLGERLRFSAFLDEITQRVLSPAQLRALGWKGAQDPLRYSPPQGRQRAKVSSQLLFPEDQLSEVGTQPDPLGPRGSSLDMGSTVEDGVGDPEFSLGQVWEELMTLKEQFLRLQEEMASTHRALRVLEEKLQSLVSRLASSPPTPPVFFLLNEAPSCSPDSSMPWASLELREGSVGVLGATRGKDPRPCERTPPQAPLPRP
ncbi:uncharacterized protein [Petaurus breviceps papuanus]|uniref:uncharacterized protein n=1 Tax=Petaurus breviceps papuanus TaxID=3040969 RepID=UPI0036D9C0EF